MAELLNTDVPMWLQKRQESFINKRPENTAQLVVSGFELGLRQQEQALRERHALMEFQQDQFKKERYLLDTEEKMLEMDDLRNIRRAQQEYMHGKTDVSPPLVTYNGNRIWHTWKSNQDVEIRQATELTMFNNQVSKLDGFGIAKVRSVGDWMEKGITPAHYENLGNEQKRVRDELLKSKYGTETIEVDGQKFLRNLSTGGLHAIPSDYSEGMAAIPITGPDGSTMAYGYKNSRGGMSILQQPGSKRHPMQNKLDSLRADAEGVKVSKSTLEKNKLPSLLAEIATIEKIIAEDQTAPPPIKGTNAPTTKLRFDPDTGSFK